MAQQYSIKERFEKALKIGGGYSLADIAERLRDGRMQGWGDGETAFVVTEIGIYPQGKFVQIVAAAGRLEDVLAQQPDIEAFGREHGCQTMVMWGRKGWAKVLPGHGWVPGGVIYKLALDRAGVQEAA